MSKEDKVHAMKIAGRLLTAAAIVSLTACAGQPFMQVDYHNSAPPSTAPVTYEQAQRNNGGAPMVAQDGTPMDRQPRTEAGPLWRAPDQQQANLPNGYSVTYHQVPGTQLSMPTLIRGNQIWVGYPGDKVEAVNSKPNATFSLNAEKPVMVHMTRDSRVVAYDPIPLPYNQAILAGANPWTAAENGGTRYVSNAYVQDRANRYGFMEPIPSALTSQGQMVPSGFPIYVPRSKGFTQVDLKGFSFSIRPDGVPTGQIVPLQTLTR